jgi:excisionase family DNA binding protein
MNNKETGFFTTREVSRHLGVSVGTVQSLVDKGILDAVLTQGGHRRIRLESLKQYQEKMGYQNSGKTKSIYVIHSGEMMQLQGLASRNERDIKVMAHPLELLGLQDLIDCIFIDARCKWLEESSVACINQYAKKFQIFIYNADLLAKEHFENFQKNVLMLQCNINLAILDAYIFGKMQ